MHFPGLVTELQRTVKLLTYKVATKICVKKTTVTPTQIIQKISLVMCVWGEKGREWKWGGLKVNLHVCLVSKSQ